jgi:CIC family chloride channel protein
MLPHNTMQLVTKYLDRIPRQGRAVLKTCAYGLAAGGVTVAFQLAMNWIYQAGLVQLSKQSLAVFAMGSLAIILGTSLVVGWLLTSYCPDAAGSGIPQLKLAFWKDFGTVPLRVAWVKFVAGVLSIGGGASMGREGPSVQLSGAVTSNLAGLFGEPKQKRRASAAAGAAAGLAAAFNTPLAATTFALEEIIGDLNSRFLGAVLLASVLGALVVHGIIGAQPSFTLTITNDPTWVAYALTPVVAALASVVGVYFQRASLGLRKKMKGRLLVPRWMLPAAGGLITWILGVLVFWRTPNHNLGVFSLGYADLSSALAGDIGWELAAVLLVTKFVATFTCYGFGGCGGIFSPALFFGGMTGVLVTGLVSYQWPILPADKVTLAVVGMSACLGAVVWAPVTGILIVFEMTHQFSLVPALMIGALVGQAVTRKLNRENFYEAVLMQDGHRIEHVRPPRDLQGWQQLPLSAITNFRPVIVNSLDPAALDTVLKANPYDRFPVISENLLAGTLARKEALAAIAENRAPRLDPAITCFPQQSVGELQRSLIESTSQMVVLLDQPKGKVLGVITLHDLLRAQVASAEQSGEGDFG